MEGLWFLWEIGGGDENESGRGGSGGPLNEEIVVLAVDVRLENREGRVGKINFNKILLLTSSK